MRTALLIASLAGAATARVDAASATSVGAVADRQTILVGEVATIDLTLHLEGDVASVFESGFELIGLDSIASATLFSGGPTWALTSGSIQGGSALLSLISSNTPGSRQVGRITITGLAPGVFQVLLAPGPVASKDTDTDPFREILEVATGGGTVLATVTVTQSGGAEAQAASSTGGGVTDLGSLPSSPTQDVDEQAIVSPKSARQLILNLRLNDAGKAEGLIEQAVAHGDIDGVAFARELLTGKYGPLSAGEYYSVLNGLGQQTSLEAMQLSKEQVAALPPLNPRRSRAMKIWARSYKERHGLSAYLLAASELENKTLDPLDRALRLVVLSLVGRGPDGPERSFVLEAYRPYLRHPEPELRRAAVLVTRALWDYDALSDLRVLAEADEDPSTREVANQLVGYYLAWGPDRPGPNESTFSLRWRQAHRTPHDPKGLQEWRSRQREWVREQHRLITGEEPPHGTPR